MKIDKNQRIEDLERELEKELKDAESPPKAAGTITLNKKKLIQTMGELMGFASLCWSEPPKGIFKSENAAAHLKNVMLDLENTTDVSSLVCARCGQFPELASAETVGERILSGPGKLTIRNKVTGEILGEALEWTMKPASEEEEM